MYSALKSQATSAMQTAEGFTSSSRNALTVSNNITTYLDPILPLSRQALNMSSTSQTRCGDFGGVSWVKWGFFGLGGIGRFQMRK